MYVATIAVIHHFSQWASFWSICDCKNFTQLFPSQTPSRSSHRRCSVKKNLRNFTGKHLNQERLPITYHNFCHKSLVRPKSKSPNWQRSQTISYKTKFSRRDNIYLVDLKYNITYQNIWGKTKVRPIFMPWKA